MSKEGAMRETNRALLIIQCWCCGCLSPKILLLTNPEKICRLHAAAFFFTPKKKKNQIEKAHIPNHCGLI